MPLVRFQVRNQYGLGQPELYTGADGEDPKAVLDGVAVAGLVGILRQLGDLAEFAGEVFHGLQEQVTTTASRSHKLVVRVKNIEAALPPIEEAIWAQTSHLHFAYTPGLEWHPRIRNEQNHFIYNDLPRFIMDSYEECRDPPRLHLLDRFDTGGPGSCIRRYSDPTFFRRVSTGSSNEKNTEKIRKDKKTRKIKKKRSTSIRNGEFSRGTSIYSCSGRMQFASSIGNGQASPSQTASTVDRTLKSEPEHSNSFDSRTGSGYIECVFPRGSSVLSEERDSKKASPRSMEHNDNIGSAFSDQNYMHDSIEEKIGLSPSCVSWEEKEEIVELKAQQYDDDEEEDLDILLEKPEIDMLKNVDQIDTVVDDENAPASISDRSELDDIESETDNYVDALNTIESESEYDLDCQTKQEVKQDSNVSHEEIEDEIIEPSTHSPDLHAATKESDTESRPSESIIHENKPAIVEIPSNSDLSPSIDVHRSVDTHDESKVDSIISYASLSGSNDHDLQEQSGKRVITSFSDSQESPTISNASPSGSSDNDLQDQSGKRVITSFPGSQESPTISNASPSGFNGHDLQDQSGKRVITSFPSFQESPPISSASPSGSSDHDIQDPSGKRVTTSFPGSQESPIISNASPSGSNDQDSRDQSGKRVITSFHGSQESPADISDSKPVKLWTNGGLLGLQPSKPPDFAVPNTKTEVPLSTIKNGEDKGNVSMLHEDDRSIKKGLSSKNLALFQDDRKDCTPNPNGKDRGSDDLCSGNGSCHANEIEPNLKNDDKSSLMFGLGRRLLVNGFSRKLTLAPDHDKPFREQFEQELPQDSPSSSPPLEHMKISFRPVNGFETSTLKLNLDNGKDMFPSFQLVPDSAVPLQDTGFDSDDDDTFCRSSPYISDDCNSVQSDLNSEEWEVGENNGSKDLELYDAFCRIEGSESVSSIENGVEHTLSCPLPEPLRLDQQEAKVDDSDPTEANPLPPPLPPVQWRLMKSQPEMKQEPSAVKEALELVKPSITQQAQLPQINIEAVRLKPTIEDRPKINGQNKAKQASNEKGVVEREDFLHQIRTQSFNLRPITPAKPAPATAPTSNVSVTAILEKASAIRQAVASDDGEEEDTWSDT